MTGSEVQAEKDTGWKACATDWARELEVRRRRAGALHPDACAKLHVAGAAFAVPPRGVRIVPRFAGAEASVEVIGLEGADPAERLLSLARLAEGPRCRRCGRPTGAALEIAAGRDADFLSECFGLARRLLLCQYELSDAELSELLAFTAGQAPAWIAELLRWCAAGGQEDLPQMPQPVKRRWWRWK